MQMRLPLSGLAAALCALAGCADDYVSSKPPYLAASNDIIDFGEVPVGDAEQRALFLINKGDLPMTLQQPDSVLQGVFSTVLGDDQVAPADEVIVHISFSPEDAIEYDTEIVFPNDSQNEPEFKVRLRGKGVSSDPCRRLTCNTPPGRTCVTSTTSRSYSPFGVCAEGHCTYEAIDEACPQFGCNLATGACAGDPCLGVACQTPPSGCYLANGQCNGGTCLYQTNNGADCSDNDLCTLNDACSEGTCRGTRRNCEAPPGPSCISARTLRRYDPQGTCTPTTGTCVYTPQDIDCAWGCENNACKNDPCAGGCDDHNPCTRDSCPGGLGCQHDIDNTATCVAASGDCPTGICSAGQCLSKPNVTCVAEYGLDLCQTAEVAGVCSANGKCTVTQAPPGYTCPGCNGICIKCFINICIPF